MKARDVVGRRIVKVEQERKNARDGGSVEMVTELVAIHLDNGYQIRFSTIETDHGVYWTEGVVYKPERQP